MVSYGGPYIANITGRDGGPYLGTVMVSYAAIGLLLGQYTGYYASHTFQYHSGHYIGYHTSHT